MAILKETVIGKTELTISIIEGTAKETNKQYRMMKFTYVDPFLKKEIGLSPNFSRDRSKLDLIYLEGFTPPNK